MKRFETPEMQVVEFEISDVITTSNGCADDEVVGCDNDLGL